MAVYTRLSHDDARTLAAEFCLGEVISCQEIAEGVENSNFLLTTQRDDSPIYERHILTLYEKRMNPAELPFFLELMEHLAAKGFPSPRPLHTRSDTKSTQIHGKTAAIVTFLHGKSTTSPSLSQMHQLGEYTARMHLACADFTMRRPNNLSLSGWQKLITAIGDDADSIEAGLTTELQQLWQQLAESWPTQLPSGIIHADLFQDNVFFEGDKLSGFIDFYFACSDSFAYELAITINAWCFDDQTTYNPNKVRAFLKGYQEQRPLNTVELDVLPILLQGAALRFLLTRSYDWINHDPQALVTTKDPKEYLHKLRWHQQHPQAIAQAVAA